MQETLARAQEALDLAKQIAAREGLQGEDREKFVRTLSHKIGVPPLPGISLRWYFIGMALGAIAVLGILAAVGENPFSREGLLAALIFGILGGISASLFHSSRARKKFHAQLPSLYDFWPIYVRDFRSDMETEFAGLLPKTPPSR